MILGKQILATIVCLLMYQMQRLHQVVNLSIIVLPKVLGCGVMTVTNGGVSQFQLRIQLMKTVDGTYFSRSSSHIFPVMS